MIKLLKSYLFSFLWFMLLSIGAYADVFYVSPEGSDEHDGAIETPFLTIQEAQKRVSPGDTVYIRGGIYRMKEDQISSGDRLWANVTTLSKSGTGDHPIRYWAYPGETPVFDYRNVRPRGFRVVAFKVNGSYLHLKGLEVIGIQVTIPTHTQSECFSVYGSHNLFEALSMHDGMGIGLFIHDGTDNLVLNCDAYQNWDSVSEGGKGGNVDGFGSHSVLKGSVNTFRGCRAWLNSDDGFDCINSSGISVFDHCWAFYNGYKQVEGKRRRAADGNGFKGGGYAAKPMNRLPDSIPVNTIQFCLAVGNSANGFYANHHLNGNKWFNNSACRNGINYNMVNRKTPEPSDILLSDGRYNYNLDVPGYRHLLVNNISFSALRADTANIDLKRSKVENNSFDLYGSPSEKDFVSLDENQLMRERNPDGSLPEISFMRLREGSKYIDAGKDLGFPFIGEKPDLGCFEFLYQ